jgi:hypothetical protein
MTEAEWESVRTAKRAERQALLSGKSQ